MRKQIRRFLRRWLIRLRPLISRLQKLWELGRRAWQWANHLQIPLSPLQWILLFYAIFGLAYAGATPIFEADDELWHFGVVQHLRQAGDLPRQVFDGRETIYAQHGSQPPLYYALAALLTAPIDIADADDYRQLNPHVSADQPEAFGNKNRVIHARSESLWQGAGLAVLIIRFLGLALGLGTITLVYKISLYLAPQRPTVAFVAAALTGLNPMFIFVSASVNNDALAMLLNGALIWLILRCLRDGCKAPYSLAIGVVFALSCLTKLTALTLLPVLLSLGAFDFYRRRDRRGLLIYGACLLLFWIAIAGWWVLRNMQLYDEPLGMMMMANIAGPRGMTFSPVDLLTEFQRFRMSYWGLFGAQNIQVTAIFYLLLDLMTFSSVVGCLFLILQLLAISDFAYARYELRQLLALLGAAALLWLGILYWNLLTPASDGRVLFPLIAVISPLLAVGFVEVVWWIVFSLRPPNLEFVRAGDAVPRDLLHRAMSWQLRFLGLVALLAPFTVIASQYHAPQPIAAIPAFARPVYAEFGDVALVAYERSDRRYSPGDRVRVKLYWQVLSQSARDNSLLLSLMDDNNQVIGRYTTYPGAGALRSSRWQPGALYPDEYLIAIHTGASGRYPFDLRVQWAHEPSDEAIAATDADGQRIEPVLLDIGAVVSLRMQTTLTGFIEIPADDQPSFDESLRLQQFLLDQELNEIILHWKTDAAPADDFTVFLHVLDENGAIAAQADGPPRLPTHYWRWGESYFTYHQLPEDLDLLQHQVIVGWYLNDGETYPKTEFRVDGEEGEAYLDAYTLPWEIVLESMQLTAEAALTQEAATPAETAEAPSPPPATAPDNG